MCERVRVERLVGVQVEAGSLAVRMRVGTVAVNIAVVMAVIVSVVMVVVMVVVVAVTVVPVLVRMCVSAIVRMSAVLLAPCAP